MAATISVLSFSRFLFLKVHKADGFLSLLIMNLKPLYNSEITDPKPKQCTQQRSLFDVPFPQPKTNQLPVSLDFLLLDTSCKWSHTTLAFGA